MVNSYIHIATKASPETKDYSSSMDTYIFPTKQREGWWIFAGNNNVRALSARLLMFSEFFEIIASILAQTN